MRKVILSIFVLFLFVAASAQAPNALNYQAVARNSTGQVIPSQSISIRFTVIDGSVSGTALYAETQNATTNSFGLFTLAIGKGNPTIGDFSSINWGSGDKFLKVEIAPQGGSNYTLQGTTQLLSVPYALYAEKTNLAAGNNTVTVTNGNTITGNYQPANNTIAITGNTIAGNYQAANNTIAIAGNTIAANYQSGTGINITGNTISATGGSSLWVTDPEGIHSQSGFVGIGRNASNIYPLSVHQPNTGVGQSIALFESDDTYQATLGLKSNVSNKQFTFMVSANAPNHPLHPGGFAICNGFDYALVINGTTSNIGIGPKPQTEPNVVPKSTLDVFSGDVNIEQIGSGIILKSPDGQCWRITIDNSGNLVRTAIPCP